MSDEELLRALAERPQALPPNLYLRALQLRLLRTEPEATIFGNPDSLRRAIDATFGQHTDKSTADAVIDRFHLYSGKNLIQEVVTEFATDLHDSAPIPAGFLPHLDMNASAIRTPAGDCVIGVDLGFFVLLQNVAWLSAELIDVVPRTLSAARRDQLATKIANATLFVATRGEMGAHDPIPTSLPSSVDVMERFVVCDALTKGILSFVVGHEVAHVMFWRGLNKRQIGAAVQYGMVKMFINAGATDPNHVVGMDGTITMTMLAALKGASAQGVEIVDLPGARTQIQRRKRSHDLEYLADFFAVDMTWRRRKHLMTVVSEVDLAEHISVIAAELAFPLLTLIEDTYEAVNTVEEARTGSNHPSPLERQLSLRQAPAHCLGGSRPYWDCLTDFTRNQCEQFSDLLGCARERIVQLLEQRFSCPRCRLRLPIFSFAPGFLDRAQQAGSRFPGICYRCGMCGLGLIAISYCSACQHLTINFYEPPNPIPFCSSCKNPTPASIDKPIESLRSHLKGRMINAVATSQPLA